MAEGMQIGIIGGGIMGISLGYFLSKKGVKVEIFEASPVLGGLAGPIKLEDGTPVDRFYHAILSSDDHLQRLCEELGIADQLRFRQTRMGFYHEGRIHPMNDLLDFLRFPPLNWADRFRLGMTILYAQFLRDWHSLENASVESWLLRLSGRRAYENIWRPMLRAKFDGSFTDIPATYIWSRLVRMKSTRSGANQKEEAGHLIGGYSTLMQAMARKIETAGGTIHLNCPVQEIVIQNGSACGLRLGDQIRPFDGIVGTVQAPVFQRLLPAASRAEGSLSDFYNNLGASQYLGIVVGLLVLDRSLTNYWTLNITDDEIPFTGVIETTAYIDPLFVGGHHLVYLPKYTAPGSQWQKMPDDEIRAIWLENLKRMFPDFKEEWIQYFLIHRERLVEPIHRLNGSPAVPPVTTPVKNLYLATTAQIYPALTNGESVTRHALSASAAVLQNY